MNETLIRQRRPMNVTLRSLSDQAPRGLSWRQMNAPLPMGWFSHMGKPMRREWDRKIRLLVHVIEMLICHNLKTSTTLVQKLLWTEAEPSLGCSKCCQNQLGCPTCWRRRDCWRILHHREALP